MKQLLIRMNLALMALLTAATLTLGQGENINLQAGNYDMDPYPAFNPSGSITGTYTINTSKSAHTFTAGQFTINVAFPPGAVYAGGAVLPAGFAIQSGTDGSSAVVIEITADWSGTGPTALRKFVLPIRIVGPSQDQPTGTLLVWNDPFVTENPVGNSTGSPLNVANVLPVKLISFTVTKENTTANLAWSTSEEINSDYFSIERSADARQWTSISSKQATGNSKTNQSYSFSDGSPLSGTNYYRLKMVDKDGTFAYSSIQSINFEGEGLSLYPNPVIHTLFLTDVDLDMLKEVSIINANGIVVYRSASVSSEGINVKNLASGIYHIQVTRKDGAISKHKVIISK